MTTRLPRLLSRVVIACSLSVPIFYYNVSTLAQETPAPAAQPPAQPPAPAPAQPPAPPADQPATPPPAEGAATPTAPAEGQPAATTPAPDAEQDLKQSVENFWHYGKIARYDMAKAAADKIVAQKGNPEAVLVAFEQVSQDRKDDLDAWLIRWQGTELRESANQVMGILNQGRQARRANPQHIEENIKRLNRPGRPYQLGVQRLRDSGELAVPIMIDYLRDPAKAQFNAGIRSALRDLGRPALNPLLAATEMKNANTLVELIGVLGDIGYNVSVPYLARLATGQDQPQQVRLAASQALTRIGVDPRGVNPAESFYELAEKFYYDNADIVADRRDPNAPANIWYWDEAKGLQRKQIPQQIFNELMAMRASEYSMKLGAQQADPLSLWLAANYKREVELPEGATDPTRAENQPNAHFYGVDSGPTYLNNALSRTLRDRDWAAALKVVRSLNEIIGNSTLMENNVAPLVEGMAAADRPVRFESAFAVAAAVPQRPFTGQDRVVPLLAEAISQTGTPSIVIVLPTQDQANAITDGLKKENYAVIGAVTPEGGIAAASQLPAVDVLIISEQLGSEAVDRLLALAARDQKLSGASKVVITRTNASDYAVRAATDPTLSVTQATDVAGIKQAADAARNKGTAAINPELATTYALRAAELLQKLAMSRSTLDLAGAEGATLAALRDARPEVVKTAGNALGWLNSKDAQSAILAVASNEKTGDDVKISLYKSLATNAKNFGNRLSRDQVSQLDKLVEALQNNDVKAAAAEARGALTLPPDQAKQLIVNQSRV